MQTFYKFLLYLVLIIAGSWALSYIMPWWTFTVLCFIVGILARQWGFYTFVTGFVGAGLYYVIFSTLQGSKDNFQFADKIGSILGSSIDASISGFVLLCVGTFLFALLGGLFAWSSSLILTQEPSNRLGSGRGRNKERSLKLDLKRYK